MKLLPTLAIAAAMTGICSAATIVQTQNYSVIPNDGAVLTFDQFDTSLGTLLSITITTQVTKSDGSMFIDNDSGTPGSGNISQTVTISLSSTDVILQTASFQQIGANLSATTTYAATVAADDGDGAGFHIGGTDYDGTDFADSSLTSQTRDVGALFFGDYQGTGTFDLDLSSVQFFDTGGIGGIATATTPATAFGDVIITYTYDAIPEPASALLGGIGMLALLRRRRR